MIDKIIKKEKLRIKYYWEFLRRNKNFQADLRSLETELSKMFKQTFEKKYGLKRRNGESLRKFVRRLIRKVAFATAEYYGLKNNIQAIYNGQLPFSPLFNLPMQRNRPYPWEKNELIAFYEFKLMPKLRKFQEKWDVWYPYIMHPPSISEEQKAVSFRKSGFIGEPYLISPGINLTFPKERIMNELEFWINFYKKEQIKAKSRGEGKPGRFREKMRRSRPPWQLFDRYLKIWDLRQEGKKFGEIAKIIDPKLKSIKPSSELSKDDERVKGYNKRVDVLQKLGYSPDEAVKVVNKEFGIPEDKENQKLMSAIRRIWYGCEQAEKLINGGYKEL